MKLKLKLEKLEIIAGTKQRQKQVPKKNESELKTRSHLNYSKTSFNIL